MGGFVVFLLLIAFVGGWVGRWRLLLVLAALWGVWLLVAALTGGIHDREWPSGLVAVLALVFVLVPIEIAATIGIVSGRRMRPRPPRRPPRAGRREARSTQ